MLLSLQTDKTDFLNMPYGKKRHALDKIKERKKYGNAWRLLV
jgi:hypothetical protein